MAAPDDRDVLGRQHRAEVEGDGFGLMPRTPRVSDGIRSVLLGLAIVLVSYLAVLAWHPDLRERIPLGLRWFGRPGSWQTITFVVALLVVVCVLTFVSSGAHRAGNATLTIVVSLTVTNFVLGLSSYWRCYDSPRTFFYTPLMWTVGLLKGGIDERSINNKICPAQTPVALEVARLSVLAAILLGIGGVVIALLQSQADRIRVGLDKSVTVVVGINDDARSMLSAVRRTLEANSRLVLITDTPDLPCVQESRRDGARVVRVDFDRLDTLESLSLWPKLDRLYLLSPDPSANLMRLGAISAGMSAIRRRRRLPLIVRIDDPWQAQAWRAQQFGGSDTRWAADAVGMYEVTARRLLDKIITGRPVTRIMACGTSPLTLALCGDMAQRHRERSIHTDPTDAPLPILTLVGENAEEYRQDHEYHQDQLGLSASRPDIDALPERPSVPVLTRLINAGSDVGSQAVIFVDGNAATTDATIGTRLATRFPSLAIYAWDPNVRGTEDRVPIVGQLRSFTLAMDLPAGAAQDAWERAAMLIHEHYADAFAAQHGHRTDAMQPWAELDEFYRGSNRRQVRRALWMVETIAGHTWNTVNGQPLPPLDSAVYDAKPLEALRLMGFGSDAVMAMARAEHDDWCRYYREAGWKYGPVRDDDHKIHDKLLDWDAVSKNPDFLGAALTSLAATLLELAELGYRSKPLWERYRRHGILTAEQRHHAWKWTSGSGNTLDGSAGDWAVHDDAGNTWSVRDDIFRATHEHLGEDRWRRTGFALARPARAGESIDTLEGSAIAADGDWIVRGEQGEQWPVPVGQFWQRYEGPLPPE